MVRLCDMGEVTVKQEAGVPRVLVLANMEKPAVGAAMEELRRFFRGRAKVVGEVALHAEGRGEGESWPEADVAVVLGGDGTVLGAARQMIEAGKEIPVLGVNFGKLGFLAELSLEDVLRDWQQLVEDPRCRSRRLVMSVELVGEGGDGAETSRVLALNDAVVTAGPPFRMIEIELVIEPEQSAGRATVVAGDGVIVSTPGGSTAYNLSAGGPIVQPDLEAMCITPICPHSLAFRPIVVKAESLVRIRVRQANPGTSLVVDGQVTYRFPPGGQVLIRRHPRSLVLIRHPRRSYWEMLAGKLHWAARPRSG